MPVIWWLSDPLRFEPPMRQKPTQLMPETAPTALFEAQMLCLVPEKLLPSQGRLGGFSVYPKNFWKAPLVLFPKSF